MSMDTPNQYFDPPLDLSSPSTDALFESWDTCLEKNQIYGFALSRSIFHKSFLPYEISGKLIAVFDNNPALHNKTLQGFQVRSAEDIRDVDGKIIIFYWNHREIAKQLMAAGLEPYKDFWDFRGFLSFYHWKKFNKLHLANLDIPIIFRCTLACEECGMLMPKMRGNDPASLDELIYHADCLFKHVDYIHTVSILGGEPLLNPALPSYLNYLADTYNSRIAVLQIVTNGTITPHEDLLNICSRHGIRFAISDYSGAGIASYGKSLQSCEAALRNSGIQYTVDNFGWNKHYRDMSGPLNVSKQQMRAHYLRCQARPKNGFYKGSFFPCCIALAADMAGVTPLAPHESLNLDDPDCSNEHKRLQLLKYAFGHCDQGFLNHCEKCNGYDPVFYEKVETAKQIRQA